MKISLTLIVFLLQGILGSVQSGKSALVHRYLTGSYMQEESPEGKSTQNITLMRVLANDGKQENTVQNKGIK